MYSGTTGGVSVIELQQKEYGLSSFQASFIMEPGFVLCHCFIFPRFLAFYFVFKELSESLCSRASNISHSNTTPFVFGVFQTHFFAGFQAFFHLSKLMEVFRNFVALNLREASD